MKEFRIFIENLPETLSESEIQSTFSNYGEVVSVEIKERKIVTNKHTSCFFAYVNLKTTDEDLQTCFQEFSETEWCGQYVKLKIAKESFLERLKREREEKLLSNDNKAVESDLVDQSSEIHSTKPTSSAATKSNVKKLGKLPIVKDKNIHTTSIESSVTKKVNEVPVIQGKKLHKKETSSSSESSDEEDTTSKKEVNTITEDVDDDILIVKRPKKEARFVNGLLKIESFGKAPIAKISTKNEKILDNRQAEAEAKRKKAVQDKIRAYHQQKKQFSSFLTRPKIIRFNDDDDDDAEGSNNASSASKKLKLFDSDSECDEQHDQKFIEDKIKRDERFINDSRFEEKQYGVEENTNEENDWKILEEVLGNKVNSKKRFSQNEDKPYIRYDPTNPEHEKYVINDKKTYNTDSSKKKKIHNNKMAEIKEAEPVSSGRFVTFHKDYKSLMENTSGFSLRQLFDNDKVAEETAEKEIPLLRRENLTDQNPFKYDSSDDEEEPAQIHEEEPAQIQEEKPVEFRQPKKVWTEPLFLQDDDFRFQEGLDFVKRIAERKKDEGQFEEERRKFKQIVKTKIRNIKKKKEQFTKKLGGNRKKKKKMKRINKALNR